MPSNVTQIIPLFISASVLHWTRYILQGLFLSFSISFTKSMQEYMKLYELNMHTLRNYPEQLKLSGADDILLHNINAIVDERGQKNK